MWCGELLMSFLSVSQKLEREKVNISRLMCRKNLLAIILNIIAYDRFSIMKPFDLSVRWSWYCAVEDSRSTWIHNLMLWTYVGWEIWMNFQQNFQFKFSILVGCFTNLKIRLAFKDKNLYEEKCGWDLPNDQHLGHQHFLWEEASAMELLVGTMEQNNMSQSRTIDTMWILAVDFLEYCMANEFYSLYLHSLQLSIFDSILEPCLEMLL